MIFTQKQVEGFIDIYERQFGVKLSCAEAREKGAQLVSLFKTINDYYYDNGPREKKKSTQESGRQSC